MTPEDAAALAKPQPDAPVFEALATTEGADVLAFEIPSIIQQRVMYAVLAIRAEDLSGFPITSIRAYQIKDRVEKTFGLPNEQLGNVLKHLVNEGMLEAYDATVRNDPIYNLTNKGREALGLKPYQLPRRSDLPRIENGLKAAL